MAVFQSGHFGNDVLKAETPCEAKRFSGKVRTAGKQMLSAYGGDDEKRRQILLFHCFGIYRLYDWSAHGCCHAEDKKCWPDKLNGGTGQQPFIR